MFHWCLPSLLLNVTEAVGIGAAVQGEGVILGIDPEGKFVVSTRQTISLTWRTGGANVAA